MVYMYKCFELVSEPLSESLRVQPDQPKKIYLYFIYFSFNTPMDVDSGSEMVRLQIRRSAEKS